MLKTCCYSSILRFCKLDLDETFFPSILKS
jgi:hypothetical protein